MKKNIGKEEREQLNIKLYRKTRERLDEFGSKGDTYEDILIKLMDLAEGIKKRVR